MFRNVRTRYTLSMAARANSMEQNPRRHEIVDLRRISVRDLEPLLADEIQEWRTELDWDFEPSADLVRKYAGANSLGGAALMLDDQVAGYGYAVLEEPRGIIGDIYVRPHLRGVASESEIFRSLLDALMATPRITRMESQLMLVTQESAALIAGVGSLSKPVRLFGRRLMSRGAHLFLPGIDPNLRTRFRFERWDDHLMHTAGAIIAASYKGETDSEINAQYRSPGGARRFLSNIVDFPGCGTFHKSASFVAFDSRTGEAAGMVLSSFVSLESGHISQLCVLPNFRGAGLGNELLRTAAGALYQHGAQRISLTVTASNTAAISIYDKFGFHKVRDFFAYIWEA